MKIWLAGAAAVSQTVSEGDEEIHEFLVHKLPPGKTKQALYLTNALLKAGARYDRYGRATAEDMAHALKKFPRYQS
jgi:hypothetical protein